jgi:hypothetical protein
MDGPQPAGAVAGGLEKWPGKWIEKSYLLKDKRLQKPAARLIGLACR